MNTIRTSNDATFGATVQTSKRDWLKWAGSAALAPVLTASAPALAAKPGPRAGYFPNTIVQTHDGKKLRVVPASRQERARWLSIPAPAPRCRPI